MIACEHLQILGDTNAQFGIKIKGNEMKNKGQIIYVLLGVILMSIYAEATTVFARQYNMQCSSCHVGMPPMLNRTGMTFFRNGFRFSKDDLSTLKRVLDDNNSIVPLGIFVGAANKHVTLNVQTPKGKKVKDKKVTNPTLALFLSGSLNNNWSTFVGGKFSYHKKDPLKSDRTFKMLRKKFYLQYTNDDTKHVTRAGLISPYAQFGNVDKSSENSGLNGASNIFLTPLAIANGKSMYGFDYTYLTDMDITLLAAVGQLDESNNENDFTLGASYFNNKNFRISAIVNKIIATDSNLVQKKYKPGEKRLGERTTVMIPLEYSTNLAYINTAFVYSDVNRKPMEDYYGWETSLTVPIFEIGKVKAIFTTDNNGDIGYSFSYSQILYDKIKLSANYADFTTDNADFNALSFSINYIY